MVSVPMGVAVVSRRIVMGVAIWVMRRRILPAIAQAVVGVFGFIWAAHIQRSLNGQGLVLKFIQQGDQSDLCDVSLIRHDNAFRGENPDKIAAKLMLIEAVE